MNYILEGDFMERIKDLPDGSVSMVMADLPYGTTGLEWDKVIDLAAMWREFDRVCKPNAACVFTASQPFTTDLINSNRKFFRYTWVWAKTYSTGFANAKKMPMKKHEDVLVFYKKLPTYNPQGLVEVNRSINSAGPRESVGCYFKKTREPFAGFRDGLPSPDSYTQTHTNYPTSVLVFGKKGKSLHHTQKPVSLIEYLVRTYTEPGELVLDPTAGSGTTAVAAIASGRRYWVCEKDPVYYAAMSERIAAAEKESADEAAK